MARRVQISGIIGWLSSAFSALCCIGFSVLVSVVGAVGAGFLIQDQILIPLLAVSLLVSIVGLVGAYRRRHNRVALVLGLVSSGAVFMSVLSAWTLGVYLGLGVLLLATTWNLIEGVRTYRKELHAESAHQKAA